MSVGKCVAYLFVTAWPWLLLSLSAICTVFYAVLAFWCWRTGQRDKGITTLYAVLSPLMVVVVWRYYW